MCNVQNLVICKECIIMCDYIFYKKTWLLMTREQFQCHPHTELVRATMCRILVGSYLWPLWPDTVIFRHFGKLLKALGNFDQVYFGFGKILNLFWRFHFTIGQIFIIVYSRILSKLSRDLVTLPMAQLTKLCLNGKFKYQALGQSFFRKTINFFLTIEKIKSKSLGATVENVIIKQKLIWLLLEQIGLLFISISGRNFKYHGSLFEIAKRLVCGDPSVHKEVLFSKILNENSALI